MSFEEEPAEVDVEAVANRIESVRSDFLLSDAIEVLPPLAQQHAFQALAFLELAYRSATLAVFDRNRVRSERDRGTR